MNVSVIIPNYNKAKFIRHSLDSLLSQTYPDWEAIIVDDCSTDESWAVIQEYVSRDKRFSAVRNDKNRGGCYSRNRGAGLARGTYLIFLDSDDWISDTCLAHRISVFEHLNDSSIDILVFSMGVVRADRQIGVWRCRYPHNAEIGFLRHDVTHCWSIMMPIWRKTAFERIGGFDETFPRLQDVEVHARALLSGLKYRIDTKKEPDCFYFIEETRMTTNYVSAVEQTICGMLMFTKKMGGLVQNKEQRKALLETYLAALRTIGDACQLGKIEKKIGARLSQQVLRQSQSRWLRCYVALYRVGINRIKGMNMLYRKLYRILGGS